jgi:hypothetical protein
MKKIVHPFIANKETHEIQFTFSVELMKMLLKKHNNRNRPKQAGRVESIRSDIREGRWNRCSGNCIKFDVNGEINDGQTRMEAHVLENTPMVSSVIYGLPVEAITFQDVNRPRSAAHNAVLLSCNKTGELPTDDAFKASTLKYRIAKWFAIGLNWKSSAANPRRRMSETETAEFIVDNSVSLNFVIAGATSRHTKRPAYAAALAIYHLHHPKKALQFRDEMNSGITECAAIVALRDYLKEKSVGGDQPMYDHFNTIHAINCFHNNKPLDKKFPYHVSPSWMI